MPLSKYHHYKQEAFQSFFNFAEGGEFPSWPLELFLEVSNICDLKCAMCPTFSALSPNRFVNISTTDRGLMDLGQHAQPLEAVLERVPVVHAHGYGEPTIHPQFTDFVEHLSGFEVLMDFFTNGMHLDDQLCQTLVEHAVYRITVSFSGGTAEEYENVYLGGEFEQVLAGIRRLAEYKRLSQSEFPRIDVNSIAFVHQVEKLPEFVQLVGEAGVNAIHLKPLSTYEFIPELHGLRANFDAFAQEQLDRARTVAKALNVELYSKPFEDSIKQDVSDAPEVSVLDLKNIRKPIPNEKRQKRSPMGRYRPSEDQLISHGGTPCFEPFKTVYTSFDGKVFPCCFKGIYKGMGKLRRGPLLDTWQGEEFEFLRSSVLRNQYPAQLCGECVRKRTYPKHHGVDRMYRHYSQWYEARYGVPFQTGDDPLRKALPDNSAVLQKQ